MSDEVIESTAKRLAEEAGHRWDAISGEEQSSWIGDVLSVLHSLRVVDDRVLSAFAVDLIAERDAARSKHGRLRELIDSAVECRDFVLDMQLEAAHQVERWGVEHDAGKRPEDWFTLLQYLLGKAASAHFDGNRAKLLHHIVTGAAVLFNWWRRETGVEVTMRPGVAPPREPCTGISAGWCHNCGDCSCPEDERGGRDVDLDDPKCPLHGRESNHAEGPTS